MEWGLYGLILVSNQKAYQCPDYASFTQVKALMEVNPGFKRYLYLIAQDLINEMHILVSGKYFSFENFLRKREREKGNVIISKIRG